VSRHIVFPTIQQILQMQPRFRFALHRQAALKEKCIGIFSARSQRREVPQCASKSHIGVEIRAAQSSGCDFERERERHVLNVQTEPLSRQLRQARLNGLPPHQPVHEERNGSRMNRCRREPEQRTEHGGGIEHGHLQQMESAHSCHGHGCISLIIVKSRQG
jgi:hypothetical protein